MQSKQNNQHFSRRQVIGALGAAAVASSTSVSFPSDSKTEVFAQGPVRRWRIMRYGFGWNVARRTGIIGLYLENVAKPVTINVATPDEFRSYLAVLKESPIFYDSNGWIFTGAELVQ